MRPGRILLILLALVVLCPPILVVIYRFAPPPVTILMLERAAQGQTLQRSWRSLDHIAPSLGAAVIAAEDAGFCRHHGFDVTAMEAAAAHNEKRPNKLRGGSTISQQTAKNVFLWPDRDYIRKGLEAGFTVLEETLWGKRRILEVYLNVVEWGPGIFGAEAAAQHYFHKDASALTASESARLAAVLPSPLKWRPVNAGRYVQRRSAKIVARAQTVLRDDLDACVR
jgi:monofunctional biosynthetic peptidoglycan transglycosylase